MDVVILGVTTNPEFRRDYGSGFLTQVAETQLPLLMISIKITTYALVRPSHRET